MNDILARICRDKRGHVTKQALRTPASVLFKRARASEPPRGFADRLAAATAGGGTGLIAEIKRASPSQGVIREDFDAATLARAYAEGGATCLSVLTDKPYFQGADIYLKEAREVVDLPILRKDFMVDPFQIVESRALGADCVLLIMAVLSDSLVSEMYSAATEFGMDVLVEVHDGPELDRALKLSPRLIGINNRDLKSFEVNLSRTESLAPRVPEGITVISESGFNGPADLARIAAAGVHCFLVGESLLRAADVSGATRALLAG